MSALLLFAALLLAIAVFACHAAYWNGVCDGYQNTWLPRVRRYIRRHHYWQGDEVPWEDE